MPVSMLSYSLYQLVLITLVMLTVAGCGGGSSDSAPVTLADPVVPAPATPVDNGLVVERFAAQRSAIAARDCNDVLTGSAVFSDATKGAGLCYPTSITAQDSSWSRVGGGIAVNDYNTDGRLDIYVTQGRNSSGRLFSQQSDSSFLDMTESAGISINSTDLGAAFFDINMDGFADLISIQEGPSFLQVFNNNGDGTFSDISDTTGLILTKHAFSIAAGDHDLDGDLDLFFTHWNPFEKQNRWEFLWQNQGDGTFIDISDITDIGPFKTDLPAEQQGYEHSFTSIFANVDQDRFPDLLVASDYSDSQSLINNGGTGFVDTTSHEIDDRSGMGTTVADYDNDGDLDWFVSAIGDTREQFLRIGLLNGSRLYQNDGDGNFTDVTDLAGVRQGYWGWGTCFADFNNDGHLDLFVVNGYDGWTEEQSVSRAYERFNDDAAFLYISNGDGTFTDRATELGVLHTTMGRGLVCYDYDRDGDLDMLIANNGQSPTLYSNNTFSSGNNFLNIRLKGQASNPHAVGARIFVSVDGQEQMRELQLGSGFISQNPIEAHFGLGSAETVEQVRIVWPGLEGETSQLSNVSVNQFLVIHQPE